MRFKAHLVRRASIEQHVDHREPRHPEVKRSVAGRRRPLPSRANISKHTRLQVALRLAGVREHAVNILIGLFPF